ncbi:MAG: hypothetical protein GY862_25335 [Gammaproteobacteria bacterium]|nr:hypothetical protein [Gammaproteobacteria bacterium]
MKVEILGIDRVQKALLALPDELRDKALAKLAQKAFDSAQAQVDTHTKSPSSALAQSLHIQPMDDGGWEIGHDLQAAPHASFVHWGTPPHVIKPRNKGPRSSTVNAHTRISKNGKPYTVGKHTRTITKSWLRWAKGGSFVFSSEGVNHPGYRGDPWLVDAAKEAADEFDKIVRELAPG